MLYSMTGFAQELVTVNGVTYNLELRVLNGKNFEAIVRMGRNLRPFEAKVRRILADVLCRGKADLNIEIHQANSSSKEGQLKFDQMLFLQLMQTTEPFARDYGLSAKDLFITIFDKCLLRENFSSQLSLDNINEEKTWAELEQGLHKLLQLVEIFRATEGKIIEQTITNSLFTIEQAVAKIRNLSSDRLEEVKENLRTKVKSLVVDVGSYRLEQELFFYAERLDIAEELQRIDAHIQYFSNVLNIDNRKQKGKELNFILQELNREFNTLGVKSQCSLVQKEVIHAKEQLEQIKEQMYNVL